MVLIKLLSLFEVVSYFSNNSSVNTIFVPDKRNAHDQFQQEHSRSLPNTENVPLACTHP